MSLTICTHALHHDNHSKTCDQPPICRDVPYTSPTLPITYYSGIYSTTHSSIVHFTTPHITTTILHARLVLLREHARLINLREHGLVVMTLALHARGPEFDPRCSYCTCYTCTAYVCVLDGLLQTCCAWSHTSEFLCCHFVSTMKLIIHNTNALLGSTSPRYVVCLSCVPRFTGFLDQPTKISQHFVTMTQQLQHYIRRVTSIPNIYTKQCGCVLHC